MVRAVRLRLAAAMLPLALGVHLPIAQMKAVPPSVVAGLAARGIEHATPIQAASYERVLDGESMVLHAETGSGKSLAFMLPALCRTRQPASRSPSEPAVPVPADPAVDGIA